MIKTWLVCFFLLFALAEFGLWIKSIILPLPIYVIAGAFLALASNYEKGIFGKISKQTENPLTQTATLEETQELLNPAPQPAENSTKIDS